MELKAIEKNVYGQRQLYPADDAGRAFLAALGFKTFTPATLAALRALGVRVILTAENVGAPLN
jgi:hypothetical protein